ncbi:MAG: CoA-binding protein [Deltaproteobacteria bacterium]|nr:CoA-binding protein [Candidatus Zymogenaceae bacterium]
MQSFFRPESVAVVGATANSVKGGYHIFNNLKTYYGGRVYPVNPNYDEIGGHTCYRSVSDLPEAVELVILFIPAGLVPSTVTECAELGIRRIQIQAAGFAEVGADGEALAQKVLAIAKKHDIRVWGPNCTGSVSARDFFFAPFMPAPDLNEKLIPGPVSVIAQSGMLAGGFLVQMLDGEYFGIDKVAAIGNKMDIDEVDILKFLAEEDDTRVILMYLESISRGREFMEIARKLSGKKHLVLLKAGRTEQSRAAALSHTGSLAGNEPLVAGALAQSGVIRVCDFMEMIHVGQALATLPVPAGGRRVAVITVTGGGGIVSTDLLSDWDLEVPDLAPETISALQEIFPPWMPPKNPVDLWPTMEIRGINEAFELVVPVVMRDPNIDAVLLLPFASPFVQTQKVDIFTRAMKETKKPIVSWVFGFPSLFETFEGTMRAAGIPVFRQLSQAAKVLASLRTPGVT